MCSVQARIPTHTPSQKSRLYEAGRPRLRLWVQNDRKKIRLHRQPLFGRGSTFSYPIWPFEWLTREGANFRLRLDTRPEPSRFRGREGCQNDRMVPNYLRVPAHVSTNGPHITIYIIIPSRLTIGVFIRTPRRRCDAELKSTIGSGAPSGG